MKFPQFCFIAGLFALPLITAVPTVQLQGGDANPLASLPTLWIKPEDDIAFMNVDTDGVYRAYRVDGTVTDAKRLTDAQIETFLSASEASGDLTDEEVAEYRAKFADVHSSAVPEEHLLDPPDEVKPLDKLALYDDDDDDEPADVSRRDLGPLIARQFRPVPLPPSCPIPGYYCLSTPQTCRRQFPQRCVCNGVICQDRIVLG